MTAKRIAAVFGPNSFLFGDYYNQMALDGFLAAARQFRVEFDLVISPTRDRIRQDLESCVKVDRYSAIIAVGNIMQEPVVNLAKQLPRMRFALVDGSAKGIPNVVSYTSDPYEISWLCGQIAIRMSPESATGCILWSDNWVARQWMASFILGAKSMQPDSKVYYSFATDAEQAFQKASIQFESGVEIIMCHAGSADLGIIRAARDKGKYALGFLNEREIDRDHVLFDVTRDTKPILIDAIRRTSRRTFRGGQLIEMGLREGSLGLDMKNVHGRVGKKGKVMINQMMRRLKSGKFDSSLQKLEGRSIEEIGGTVI